MLKMKFLAALHDKLSALPKAEIEERVLFYSEMIDERMEEGLTEEEAVAAIGSVDEIVAQITAELPPQKKIERAKPKKRKAWEIVLLVLGSPLWLSLLLAAFAVVFSLYISLCAILISLWAVFGSFVGCGFGLLVGGIVLAFFGRTIPGAALIGSGLVCAGLSILLFFGCRALTKLSIRLVKWIFMPKRNAKKEKGDA